MTRVQRKSFLSLEAPEEIFLFLEVFLPPVREQPGQAQSH